MYPSDPVATAWARTRSGISEKYSRDTVQRCYPKCKRSGWPQMTEEGRPIQWPPKPGQLLVHMNGPDFEVELLTAEYCLLPAQRPATDHARLKVAMMTISECMNCVDIAFLSDQSRSQQGYRPTAPSSPLFKTSTRPMGSVIPGDGPKFPR